MFSTISFDPSAVSFPVASKQWITVSEESSLYELLLAFIASHKADDEIKAKSFDSNVFPAKNKEKDKTWSAIYGRIGLKVGYGEFAFHSNTGKLLHALHQHVGKPVGTNCGAKVLSNLVVFSDESVEELAQFLSWLVEKSEETEEGSFICYSWHVRHQYWRQEARITSRPLASVVLPAAVKSRLIDDVEKFLSPRTQEFYTRNGIPYRRSYLFHGLPGTGKTSMVQALAGHFNRSVCFLMPTHPEMTDDSLRDAINRLPEEAIVVFEDIDALFTKSRENKVSKSSLTFSGLLNALDGIGNPCGQIFVLTTNLREELDHALIRNGRVDMHLEFTYAVPEQIQLMWRNFFPDAAPHLTQAFSDAVESSLKAQNLQVSTSGLQHYFVSQMDSTPEEAMANVQLIIEEILFNSSEDMKLAAAEAAAATKAAEAGQTGSREGDAERGGKAKKRRSKAAKKKKRDADSAECASATSSASASPEAKKGEGEGEGESEGEGEGEEETKATVEISSEG